MAMWQAAGLNANKALTTAAKTKAVSGVGRWLPWSLPAQGTTICVLSSKLKVTSGMVKELEQVEKDHKGE